MFKKLRLVSMLILAVASFTHSSFAQTITGSIRGTVTDSTGAVIPGAEVTATNADTGISATAHANESGLYSIRFLPIGRYSLVATQSQFAEYRSSTFQLDIAQEATVNIQMRVQSVGQNVVVEIDTAPTLNQENATLGITINETAIHNLPLNGRNFLATTVAVPGSIHSGGSTTEQPGVNGNRQETNSMLLDGMDIYENQSGTRSLYTPNSDALQQVRVITANASAEFGNVNGGQIIAVTKSGTNQFHGNAFFQLENYQMNANTWKNKHVPAGSPAAAITPFTQTYFGGTFGGPLLKDRLFFFADYQGSRYHQSGTDFASVAPAVFRKGDLSLLKTQLYDSQNGHALFVNNQVPILNPVAQYVFAHPEIYPLPNSKPLDGIAKNNYLGPKSDYKRNNQGDIKLDWKAAAKDSLSGRLTIFSGANGTIGGLPILFPNGASTETYRSVVIGEVHEFSSNAVNDLRIGVASSVSKDGIPTDPSGLFGLSGNQKVGINLPQQFVGFTRQNFNNGSNIGSIGAYATPSNTALNSFSYSELFSLQRGHHLMKMGGQFLRYQQNFGYSGNAGVLGVMGYSGSFSGDSFSDFLLNYLNSQETPGGLGKFGQRQWRDGVFFQDDWKVLPNLTLNLGLRYEYSQPIYEVNDKMTNVDLKTGALLAAGKNGNSRALYNPVYDQFLPRLGFAYSPTSKSVVRGGYGISSYFEGMGSNLRLTQNPPYHNQYQSTAVAPSVADPSGKPLHVQNGLSSTVSGNGNYNAWDPDLRPSLTQEFSLTTEYQLSNSTSIQIGYVGETGQHLAIPVKGNQLTAIGAVAPFASSLGQDANIAITRSNAMMNYNSMQAVFHARGSNGLDFTANYTYSKALSNGGEGYNGINGSSEQYYQQNAYDLASEYGPTGLDSRHNLSGSLVYELPFGRGRRFGSDWNRITDYALGGWKLSGIASAFSGLPLTIGSSGNYSDQVKGTSARANYLRPLHVTNRSVDHWFGTDGSAIPCNSLVNGGFDPAAGNPSQCAYSTQSYTGFGTARPGTERGPGFENIDLSGFKAFNITERQRLEFRADAFNAFNFASYNNPDTNTSSGTFGRIDSTKSTPRTLQLALSYHF